MSLPWPDLTTTEWEAKLKGLDIRTAGDKPGHEFHGNQWTHNAPGVDTRVFTTYFDPLKIKSMGRDYQLTQKQATKLFDAFVQIDDYLHDPDIGDRLWDVLSGFTPQSLRDRIDAMKSGMGSKAIYFPERKSPPPYRAAEALDDALTTILTLMAEPVIGPLIQAVVLDLVKEPKPRTLGGPGSGFFHHPGRPGHVGGSMTQSAIDSGAGTGGMAPFVDPGGFAHTGITWKQPVGPDGRPIPIQVRTVEEAIPLVLDGKVVEVPDVTAAHTLIDKLAQYAEDAKAKGEAAKEYDLCQVSVAGTNLFCAKSVRTADHPEGFSRLDMPQFSGRAVKGSEADKLPHGLDGKVDGAEAFKVFLQGIGIKTQAETVPAAQLKASQREMIGSKVGSMMNNKKFDPSTQPIFVSSDDYVIDGHHRWAAVVGRDAADNRLGDSTINIVRVNSLITEILHIGTVWSQRFGIEQAAGVVKQGVGTGLTK